MIALLLVALVADDATVMRNAPDDAAPAQATLWRGDWLEVRGEAAGFLKVYDHRRERPGYVRPGSVRLHRVEPESSQTLRALVLFLRDAAGSESLGIGYAALYLRAASAAELQTPAAADVLLALGTMADRLARRASTRGPRTTTDAALAGHLGVAEGYGIKLVPSEAGNKTLLCYDGDAYARVLTLPGAAETRARAALALARPRCETPVGPAEEREATEKRLRLLATIDPSARASTSLPPWLAARVRLRLAEAHAAAVYQQARRGDPSAATHQADAARALALVDRGLLAAEDRSAYERAAVAVAVGRWAPLPSPIGSTLAAEVTPRATGETCFRISQKTQVLVERCTYGLLWPGSIQWGPGQRTITIAAQPVAGWSELWVFRTGRNGNGWTHDVLLPALGHPGEDLGYVEVAGFSPDGTRLLTARETFARGRLQRRFEVLRLDSLRREQSAPDASLLRAFQRWASPRWRGDSLALR